MLFQGFGVFRRGFMLKALESRRRPSTMDIDCTA